MKGTGCLLLGPVLKILSLIQGKFLGKPCINLVLSNQSPGTQGSIMNELLTKVAVECSHMANGSSQDKINGTNNTGSAPAAKAHVVGWPPIRSFRKNTLATTSKNNNEAEGKASPGALFVKVSMDGAPYLRKVDLRTYCSYQELSSALEKMFSCFTIGQCGTKEDPEKEKLREQIEGCTTWFKVCAYVRRFIN